MCTLITLWGSDMGTLVLMTDLMVDLPFFNTFSENKYIKRIIPTIFLVFLCWITCILKNPTYCFFHSLIHSLLVGISSLGLFALIIAFIVNLMY